MSETTPATAVTDEQLLDLYLTGWVGGGVDNFIRELPPSQQEHVPTCADCTNGTIELFKRRLVTAWEDPAVRAAVIDVCRAVLAGEQRDPKFVASTPALDENDPEWRP